jgi:hypothetical protein
MFPKGQTASHNCPPSGLVIGDRPRNIAGSGKKDGLPEASAKTATTISVNVRSPDASLKRPVPPVI